MRAISLIGFAIFLHHAKRDDVEEEGDDEEDEAEREGGERLGAVEFLIAGQQLDDLGGDRGDAGEGVGGQRSEEHTSELQSLMRISYAVFCLKKKNKDVTLTTFTNIKHTTSITELTTAYKQQNDQPTKAQQ